MTNKNSNFLSLTLNLNWIFFTSNQIKKKNGRSVPICLNKNNIGCSKWLIKLGSKLPQLDSSKKIEHNIVKGCQSQVWLHAEFSEGKIIFEADSDAAITKGLVALMVHLYSHQSPNAILATEPTFITEIGMNEHLSPTRANGLASMVKQMKIYALAFSS